MGYKYAPRPHVKQRQDYTPLDYLFSDVSSQADAYVMVKRGRGPTHVEAYKEGALKVLELLRSGKYKIQI